MAIVASNEKYVAYFNPHNVDRYVVYKKVRGMSGSVAFLQEVARAAIKTPKIKQLIEAAGQV